MTGTDQVIIEQIMVHRVGNPTRGEQLLLSPNPLEIKNELVSSMLTKYFLHAFDANELNKFTHTNSIAFNEVYQYVKKIFNTSSDFVLQSQHLAKFLYAKSTHARVKEGELYVVKFANLPFENDFVEAIGIFKSETKEPFLKVFPNGQQFEMNAEEGININKLDKGCLVFRQNEEDGFCVCVVDNTNKQQDAQYWVNDFLQVTPMANEYHQTATFLQLCKQFATEELPQHFEVHKAEQIEYMQRSLEYFATKDHFEWDEFNREVLPHPEVAGQFAQFKDAFANAKQMQWQEDFDIDLAAVKKQSKAFKSILKLDKNFHIYIHGRRDLIERGYDEQSGKHFYKLYFETEA